jgi:hypothetical protein
MSVVTRRKILCSLAGLSLLYPLVACGKGNLSMAKEIVMDVVVFNYTNRPIYEVLLNHKVDGGGAAYDGGRGIVVGVTVPIGPQNLTWRLGGPRGMARNGETVKAKNSLVLAPEQIPSDARYMAIHIYQDETAELTFARYLPDPTPRGQKILDEAEKHGR